MFAESALIAVSILFGSQGFDSMSVGCSSTELVGAIQNAVNVGGAQTLSLEPGCAYTLTQVNNGVFTNTNGLPVIPNLADVSIEGNGATLVRDPSAPMFRFFEVEQGGQLALNNLTITGGHAGDYANTSDTTYGGDGGAILNRGVLSGSFVTFTNNIAGAGGMCFSSVSGSGGRGGAVASFNQAYFVDSVFQGNKSGSSVGESRRLAPGGAIYGEGELVLERIKTKSNPIGVIWASNTNPHGTCELAQLPNLHDDVLTQLQPGAIHHSGSMTVTNSVFEGEEYAALVEEYPKASYRFMLKDTLFYNNDKGVYQLLERDYAIDNRIESSTFISNQIGIEARRAFDGMNLIISNSTFVQNKYGVVGQGYFWGDSARGYVLMAQLENATFYENKCSIGAGYAHENSEAYVIIKNSVLASNIDDEKCKRPSWPRLFPEIVVDEGYNITDHFPWGFGNTSITPTTSISGTNPLLDPAGPKDNGGKTPTIALLPGSPAINFIPAEVCADVPTDQRGVLRPQGGKCDAGAYESLSYPRVFMPFLSH